MFKKAVVYTLGDKATEVRDSVLEAESVFDKYHFTEIPTESAMKSSIGFTKTPLGNYVDENNGDIFVCVTSQTKSANTHEVNDTLKAKIENFKDVAIQQQLADKVPAEEIVIPEPDKKLLKQLKDEAMMEVLTHTYPKEYKTATVMFRKNGQVVVDGNHNSAEKALGLIRKALGSLPCVPMETDLELSDLLDEFVANEINDVITLGEKAIFETAEDRKIQIAGNSLYQSEGQDFIKEGIMASAVEIVRDGMITCLLRENHVFDTIKFSEDLTGEFEGDDNMGTFLIQAAELCSLIDDIHGRLTEEGE